ncbi:hypothetical protein Asp14428_08560 [Actinoplanes sp. NBRC 14428]|uniref:Uncharacterized protein n=1 Tax=Pseudosporangium ferrugineum TaxID=439699 RepID=A0A2T0SG31_9ACTN|nr:hypothetical protein [Pseudosporangium ferrugineum]PRY32370.1 hypothetical protein CLV70_102581 [Pseudosporangium ferrugineum]BCJ49381.1 hypothetical protein Asp14428_08560 [Actinoplanes sp. NBRC 14428]
MSGFQLPPAGMTGTISVTPRDPSDPQTMPYIIQTDAPFEMALTWSLDGATASFLGGQWHLSIYIDNVDGVGSTNGLLGTAVVDVDSVAPEPLPRTYEYTFHFDPHTVSEGAYQVIAVVRYRNLDVPLQMRGFAETGIIDFMDA